MRTQVLISGGGVGGLMLALKLAQKNIQVIILEKETAPAIKYKGELVQPRSLVILQSLGLLDEVMRHAQRLNTTSIVETWGSNKRAKIAFHYDRIDHPLNFALMINHEVFKSILLHALKQYACITYMKPCKFLSLKGWDGQSFHKATAHNLETDTLFEIEADYIIGAEGRHSPIRRGLEIGLKDYEYNHYFLTVSFNAPPTLLDSEMIVKGHRFLGLFPLSKQRVRTALLIKPDEYKTMKRDGLQTFYDLYLQMDPTLDGYVQQIKSWKEIQLMIPVRHNAEQYVYANCVLIGDAAHSVHPMAGEGMNLALQDADALGELLPWMYETNQRDNKYLHWYELVRKPRVEYMSQLSHQSALVYSYSHPLWRAFRTHVLKRMERSSKLHYKQILNISGLGLWKETLFDRVIQAGLWPLPQLSKTFDSKAYLFTEDELYPWRTGKRIEAMKG
ncbi:MAG: hypothetical protein RLZZ267_1006 [Bacillota bacterium]|jgi:2-polyprenyl-6-methoxyphenol hydroxylase-like FAD-dependent oxidoreductase